jgi:uncharacterized membrane protein
MNKKKNRHAMHELIEIIKHNLDEWGELTVVILNAISLTFIILGLIISFIKCLRRRWQAPNLHPLHTWFRTLFGGWLIVALEVQLAADIAGTIISPTSAQLFELGAIAIIRTFLNYFLNKELEEEKTRYSNN